MWVGKVGFELYQLDLGMGGMGVGFLIHFHLNWRISSSSRFFQSTIEVKRNQLVEAGI